MSLIWLFVFMRQILIIATLLFSTVLFAQQSFEGTIKYILRSPTEKEDAQLNIAFSNNQIKIHTIEFGKLNRTDHYVLVNLDSGKVYTVNPERRTYSSYKLSQRIPATEVPPVKTIAGYSAIGQLYNEDGINSIFGSILSNKTIFYTAENLHFSIPEKFSGNYELMMVQKDKIVLGAEIHISPKMWGFNRMTEEENDSASGKSVVIIEATEVVAKKMEASDFLIPEGFTKNKPYTYSTDSTMMMDSVTVTADSTVAYMDVDTVYTPAEKPVTKKNKKNLPKKNTAPTKQNAILRKN